MWKAICQKLCGKGTKYDNEICTCTQLLGSICDHV